jgi:multidrug efflux pump
LINLSTPFIYRPVATTLLAVGVALAGAIAFGLLPVSPLPQVEFPTILVQADLPGASPETMAATVATPLERALGRISGVNEITSTSSLGSTRITLQFDLDRDIDGAARDVQGAINAARTLLPSDLPNNPRYRKVNPADAPIMILALTSDSMTQGQMYDVAATVLAQRLSQVSGVGLVHVGGSSLPAVRVELDPQKLNKYRIGLEEVRATIGAANANRPKGAVEHGDRHWQIAANDQAKTAAEYIRLIVAYRSGAAVQLSDVATVLDSVQDLRNAGSSNGKPSVLLIISRQPNANIIDTVDRVTELLPSLRASIPRAINLDLVMERTATIRTSLHEIERTLFIAVGLVVLIVFVFLRCGRASVIPGVAVPISVCGTFGVMYLLGYSLNNLTLMALTIATGFVVDDAIVVLENVSRHIERGMPAREAALSGTKEVGFTVLAMTISLIAVFIPVLLMGGIIGRYFREFAVTLSVATLISLVVSLTITPMMCSRLLHGASSTPGNEWNTRMFRRALRAYANSLSWVLRRRAPFMITLLVTIALNVWLYITVPKGLFPRQDTGRLTGNILADQSISFQAMRQKLADFIAIVRDDPAVASVVGFTGGQQRNTGQMFVSLRPLAERKESAEQVIARLRRNLAKEPGARLTLNPVQDFRVGGRRSDAQYQYTLQADDLDELRQWEYRIRAALSDLPQLVDVSTDQQDKGLQTTLVVDRDTASRLSVTPRIIDAVLNDGFGQRQVSTIYRSLNQYRVVMEAAPEYWQSAKGLEDVYLITSSGASVPLLAIAHYDATHTYLGVNHQGQFVASTISFNLPEDVSLSDATRAIEDKLALIGVPTTIHGTFQGTVGAFRASLKGQPILILAALLTIYIVLGILYESLTHPLTILSTLPSAGVGALLALILFRIEFSVIAFIGIILLVGIVKKNAIMMIDFALEAQRTRGLAAREAIFQACLLRFRPIMMTTLTAVFAALPLAIGFGDGAELRRPLGISVVGGLLVSQLLTLYTTPVVYLYMERLQAFSRAKLATRRDRKLPRHTSIAPLYRRSST